MRPVILGLTGAEALTLRAQVDTQLDREVAIIDKLDPTSAQLLQDQVSLLRALRDKLDAAMTVRTTRIAVPF